MTKPTVYIQNININQFESSMNTCVQSEVMAIEGQIFPSGDTTTTQTVHISVDEGLICNDSENTADGGCLSYKARVCCAKVCLIIGIFVIREN